jgi:hypothetical protein
MDKTQSTLIPHDHTHEEPPADEKKTLSTLEKTVGSLEKTVSTLDFSKLLTVFSICHSRHPFLPTARFPLPP